MARFGAFLWSGDVYSTWETLKTHVPVAVNTGLSGIPYWGTDIGGFVPTPEFLGDLYVRWFQFAAFCPLFRAHGRTWHLRLPWGWNTGELGPEETSDLFGRGPSAGTGAAQRARSSRSAASISSCATACMPYLYSAVRDTSRDRPADHARDVAALSRRSGRRRARRSVSLGTRHPGRAGGREGRLVPPCLPAARHLVRLLDGGSAADGGREIDRAVDLATTPLYVRAGAIVPMGPVKQYTGEAVDGPLTVTVYPGRRRRVRAVRRRRRSFAYRTGAWMGLTLRWDDRQRRLVGCA